MNTSHRADATHVAFALLVFAFSALGWTASASAQQIGAQQWFVVGQYHCLHQFNGQQWVNIGNCHVPPAVATQQAAPQQAWGQDNCLYVSNGQQWVRTTTCRNASSPAAGDSQQIQEKVARLKAINEQIQAAQAAQAASATYTDPNIAVVGGNGGTVLTTERPAQDTATVGGLTPPTLAQQLLMMQQQTKDRAAGEALQRGAQQINDLEQDGIHTALGLTKCVRGTYVNGVYCY